MSQKPLKIFQIVCNRSVTDVNKLTGAYYLGIIYKTPLFRNFLTEEQKKKKVFTIFFQKFYKMTSFSKFF
jgi:hypothetical protein